MTASCRDQRYVGVLYWLHFKKKKKHLCNCNINKFGKLWKNGVRDNQHERRIEASAIN